MMYQLMVAGQSGLTGKSVFARRKFRVVDDPATIRRLSTGEQFVREKCSNQENANIFLVSKTPENV